jgi:peptidoglycan/xylan/chitin deacetylase (PgdA/CDA1 family)
MELSEQSISSELGSNGNTISGKGQGILRVLTYHRVADPEKSPMLDPRLISATPAVFDQQMCYLSRHYRVISVEEALYAVETGARLPERTVLLTFDDAYCDFVEYAWPILQRNKLPATLFVPTAYPDQPERAFWTDRLYRAVSYASQAQLNLNPIGSLPLGTLEERRHSLKRLDSYLKTIPHTEALSLVDDICSEVDGHQGVQKSVLGWEELRQLVREGVTLGAHTRTHPIMTQVSLEQLRDEIVGSQSDLRREIGHVLPVFCYPSGAHDATVVGMLRQAGFVMAFTTLDGHNDLQHTDLLRLRRTNITQRTSAFIFRIRLLRWASYLDMWRHRRLS